MRLVLKNVEFENGSIPWGSPVRNKVVAKQMQRFACQLICTTGQSQNERPERI